MTWGHPTTLSNVYTTIVCDFHRNPLLPDTVCVNIIRFFYLVTMKQVPTGNSVKWKNIGHRNLLFIPKNERHKNINKTGKTRKKSIK